MKKLLKYMSGYGGLYIIAILFVFARSMCDLWLPRLMGDIINNGVINKNIGFILVSGGLMLLITAMSMAFTLVSAYLISKAASGFGKALRSSVFNKIVYFSNDEFNKIGTASIITRSTNDVTQVQQLVVMSRMMFTAPIMAVGGVIMALSQAASLSWILVLIISLIATIIVTVFSTVMPMFKVIQKKIDRLNLVVRETLTGVRVIRAFNRLDAEAEKFDKANNDLKTTYLKINRTIAFIFPLMMFIMNASSLLIVWFGAFKLQDGSLDIGSLMAFIQYLMLIMHSVLMMTMIFAFWPRAAVSAGRINEILDSQNNITDPQNPIKSPEGIRSSIEFIDVSFRFHGAEDLVLKNISFESGPGEITAIIGGTGAGKTSLIDLLPRFYDIESGKILINGVDIKTMTLEELRGKIGLVPQQAVLFNGTVSDNIRYGKEDATDKEIKRAAEIAQATEFISEMQGAFEADIEAGAKNISGGQKQRLSIARALVRKPEIYIFDDSFSALDFKTDAKLRADLKDEVKNATVLIVAQRVSTIIDADRILVLNDGELAGIGTHKELYENCDIYREIVLSQLSEEEIA